MTRVQVTLLVEEGFVATELALVQDALRIATRLGQGICFDLRVCSTAGSELVEAMGGMLVRAAPLPLDDATPPDHLVVLGGAGIGARFAQMLPRLRWCERMGQDILLMSDAATEWQRLNPEAEQITTHWEDHQVWSTALCELGGGLPLFTRRGRITTAAGMISAADVILNQIVAPRSAWLAQAVGNVLLMDGIRDGAAAQRERRQRAAPRQAGDRHRRDGRASGRSAAHVPTGHHRGRVDPPVRTQIQAIPGAKPGGLLPAAAPAPRQDPDRADRPASRRNFGGLRVRQPVELLQTLRQRLWRFSVTAPRATLGQGRTARSLLAITRI